MANYKKKEVIPAQKERLFKFIYYTGNSARAFEKKIGKYCNAVDKFKNLDKKWRAILEDFFPELNLDWLETGKGEMIDFEILRDRDIKSRLMYFLSQQYDATGKPLTISNFERTLGLSTGSVYKLKENTIQDWFKVKLGTYYPDLNIDWLESGQGEMYGTNSPTTIYNRNKKKNTFLPLIPNFEVYDKIMDKNPESIYTECMTISVPLFFAKGAELLVQIHGESMDPRYPDGTLLALRKVYSTKSLHWGEMYVLDTPDGYVAKKIMPIAEDEDSVLCVSENSELYPPFKIKRENIRRYYAVVGGFIIKS